MGMFELETAAYCKIHLMIYLLKYTKKARVLKAL